MPLLLESFASCLSKPIIGTSLQQRSITRLQFTGKSWARMAQVACPRFQTSTRWLNDGLSMRAPRSSLTPRKRAKSPTGASIWPHASAAASPSAAASSSTSASLARDTRVPNAHHESAQHPPLCLRAPRLTAATTSLRLRYCNSSTVVVLTFFISIVDHAIRHIPILRSRRRMTVSVLLLERWKWCYVPT